MHNVVHIFRNRKTFFAHTASVPSQGVHVRPSVRPARAPLDWLVGNAAGHVVHVLARRDRVGLGQGAYTETDSVRAHDE